MKQEMIGEFLYKVKKLEDQKQKKITELMSYSKVHSFTIKEYRENLIIQTVDELREIQDQIDEIYNTVVSL